MCIPSVGYAQISRDTLLVDSKDLDSPIYYSAADSIYEDLKKNQVHLYNNAKIDNGEIQMDAGYILIDLDKSEVYASYIYDEDSNRLQMPNFSDGSEKITASSIRYNFKSKKGYIEEVSIKQDENVLYMEVAKRHPNDEIHFKKGRFTTCDLPEPHFHFQLSKAVMIPEKRIVSGPMNLWIKGVPTPLGLPFMVIPQSDNKNTHGLLFPQIIPTSQYGYGFQDLGYYFPINDQLQTSVYATLYNRGSWGFRNVTDYAKRYKHNGSFNLGFQQFKTGFPENVNQNKSTVKWTHLQDPKANPYWNFSSNINFISDNNSKNDLDPLNSSYFNNTLSSDINITRTFPGKPITMGLKLSMRQNSLSKNISLKSPIVNVNVNRFYPFKKLVKKNSAIGEMAKRFGVTYSFEGQNRSTFADSLIQTNNYTAIRNQFQNGINQNVTIQTTASLFKNTWKFTPSINYGNKINFQQTKKIYDASTNSTLSDTLRKAGAAHSLSFNAQLNTAVYSYYKFVGKNEALLRHVLTPSFGFQYIPNLNKIISDSVGINMGLISYSPFEQSLYQVNQTQDRALITFGFNNTFELKRKSEEDTITGFKKIRIIDAFTINGNYNLLSDSMNLSNIKLSLRISPIKWLSIVANSSLSPYNWNDTSGAILSDYALVSRGKLGRLLNTSISTSVTLTSKKSRVKLQNNNIANSGTWTSDYNYFLLHPEHIVNFDIPWKVSFSHIYSIATNTKITSTNPDRKRFNQTLLINGDISFTKRWKLVSTINIDLEQKEIINTHFRLARDLHCWALSFDWTPIGGNKSFLFSIRSTSSLFKDAKIDIRKPPAFL